ncbi:MAG: MBL fold metallo-hydrolase [Promethearchaeota archaeon]
MKPFELTFLGTAASAFSKTRNPTSLLLMVESRGILLDCAEGVTQQLVRLGVDLRDIDKVFISHGHNDHVIGITTFLWHNWLVLDRRNPLEIIAPPYVHDTIRQLLVLTHTPPDAIKFEITWTPVTPEIAFKQFTLDFSWEGGGSRKLPKVHRSHAPGIHKPESHAMRIDMQFPGEDEGGARVSLCYSGDTSPSEDIQHLATGCDYLIHESTLLDNMADTALKINHSTPSGAAKVARGAGVKNLVLIHYSTTLDGQEDVMKKQAQDSFTGNVIVARELFTLP